MISHNVIVIRKLLLILVAVLFAAWAFTPKNVSAQSSALCRADINQDGIVDLTDYSQVATNFLKTVFSNPRIDINSDGIIDLSDYSQIAINFLKPATGCVSTPSPAPAPSAPTSTSGEWTQFAHNSQRTSFTSQYVPTPWKYKWQWNGAGADGKKKAGHLSVPDLIQPITGAGNVYIVAADSLYALDQNNGSQKWSRSGVGTLSATPAYKDGFVYLPSSNGNLYKVNAVTGALSGSFNSGTPLTTAVLEVNGSLYVVGANGILYKINAGTMTKIWEYSGGSAGATPASYSPSRDAILYVTQDLFVHAVNNSNGSRKWRVKPTPRNYTVADANNNLTEAREGWPVIAEQHGIVFIRYRLEWNTLWAWNPYPTTNAAIRNNLTAQPNQQALFALSLDSGATSFVPAVGNGGAGDGGVLPMGPQPVIRVVDGKEVAYMIWRNGLTCASGWCDGREDAAMGEMVLDNNTVTGYVAGDMRFIRFTDIQTDEMMNITMSNDILFHSHWLVNAAVKITDRSSSKGATFTNPITTVDAPFVIWRQVYCPTSNINCNPQIFPGGSGTSWGPSNCPFNAATRYCSTGLYAYGDQRAYPAGFYEYHNDNNSGSNPYAIVSNNLVIVKTNDGAIMALENGNPATAESENYPSLASSEISRQDSQVLGYSNSIPSINYYEAKAYVGQNVTISGKIRSVVDNRPKAIYLGFKKPHDGELLVRIFEKDLMKFDYDLSTLLNKDIKVTGFVSLYWPDLVDPEIVVTDPSQITW